MSAIDTLAKRVLPLTRVDSSLDEQHMEQMITSLDKHQLAQVLASLFRLHHLDVRLDMENLYIGLRKLLGRSPEAAELVEAIKMALADLGEIKSITAYADWFLLDKKNNDLPRQLELLGVETRYMVNIKNKNSADMKIVGDITDQLERELYLPGMIDVFVLGSGDRDFRSIVQKIRSRRIGVVVLTLRSSLSQMLGDLADEVRYLEDYLPVNRSPYRGGRHEFKQFAGRVG